LKSKTIISIFCLFLFYGVSCVNRDKNGNNESKINELASDTTKLYVTYKNSVFCVPSPQLVNLYLKRLGIYPVKSAINPISNLESYTTSPKKAMNLGVYGADLGYMNLFIVSENTNEYIAAISQLSQELGMGVVFTHEVYDQILALKNDQDSLATFLSGLFSKADDYLKNNSQQQVSAMVIAGGWVESFYLLCSTYNYYKSKEIKDMIFQQKFVLENLIKGLAPYYDASPEMKILVDNLVDMAYDFDMLDFKYSYKTSGYTLTKGVLIFNNEANVSNSSQTLDIIIRKVTELREKTIS
jgi:hypothetical protein